MRAKGRSKVTGLQWERLIDSYRRHPGEHMAASRAAICDHRTAKRAWSQGLQGHAANKPIEVLLREEQTMALALTRDARLQQAKTEAEVKAKAREEAAENFAREGKLAGGYVQQSIIAMGMSAKLVTSAFKAMPWLERQLEACAAEDPAGAAVPCKACGRPIPPGQVLGYVERVAKVHNMLIDAGTKAVELLRLHLGEPQKILDVHGVGDKTPEECEAALEAMLASVRAAKLARAQPKPATPPKAEVN